MTRAVELPEYYVGLDYSQVGTGIVVCVRGEVDNHVWMVAQWCRPPRPFRGNLDNALHGILQRVARDTGQPVAAVHHGPDQLRVGYPTHGGGGGNEQHNGRVLENPSNFLPVSYPA